MGETQPFYLKLFESRLKPGIKASKYLYSGVFVLSALSTLKVLLSIFDEIAIFVQLILGRSADAWVTELQGVILGVQNR